jgi:outer membrane biosynthesis protein TonB
MSAPEHQSAANGTFFNPLQPMATSYRRGAAIALVVTVLLHLGLLLSMPETLLQEPSRSQRPAAFEIVLDEAQPEEEAPSEPRFVEANPNVPENPPDDTEQYSFRDQQAADESERPVVDGEPDTGGEEDSQKIVESPPLSPELMEARPGLIGTGDEDTDEPPADASAEAEPIEADLATPTRAPADAFPFDDPEADGDGVRLDPGRERIESEDSEDGAIPLTRTDADATVQADSPREASRPQPRPRPRLAPDLVEAPLRQSQGASTQRGEVAIDATFSAFGEYQQQLIIAVQRGWFQEIEFFQPLDAAVWVHVRFVLQADGSVRDLRVVESTASELATFLCTAAIEKRSPFRPWTREMTEVFGQEQTLNFRFFYR